MTRLVLIALLVVLCSSPAYAEWVPLYTESVPSVKTDTAYVDLDTIRRKGDPVKMWGLVDFAAVRNNAGKLSWSAKGQWEYDCAEEQTRVIAEYGYSGQMGFGEIVYSIIGPAKWQPVIPNSGSQTMWKVACGRP